jgi:hypothetical protein
MRPLYRPIIEPAEAIVEEEEPDIPIWRATGQENQVLGQTIGKMVHKAIQRWRFPGDPGLMNLLDIVAREAGVVEESRRLYALQEAEPSYPVSAPIRSGRQSRKPRFACTRCRIRCYGLMARPRWVILTCFTKKRRVVLDGRL